MTNLPENVLVLREFAGLKSRQGMAEGCRPHPTECRDYPVNGVMLADNTPKNGSHERLLRELIRLHGLIR